ncbi:MAG: toll/interleukin-1 receptor domain-containing protein [Deltaproteobacteria bacterium]|nr:toll/interleukin-1 receptor domain-containing protein [Deltaproteobacteria bacterium]
MVKDADVAKKWLIFLSHSSKDKQFVDWLHDKLRSANLELWYDKYEILVGDSILEKIYEGLDGSEFFLVVLSKAAVASEWVKRELEPKTLEEIEKKKVVVLPVVLDDITSADIPPFIRAKKHIRFPGHGSEEKFSELMDSIDQHVKRRDLTSTDKPSSNVQTSYSHNPFGLRGGVDPKRCVVHGTLVRSIIDRLLTNQSVSIVGARMLGKTSLLKFLASTQVQPYFLRANADRSAFQFVYVDMQEHSGQHWSQFVPQIAQAMSSKLTAEPTSPPDTHKEALDWIKTIVGRQDDEEKHLWVIMIDEFDKVAELYDVNKQLFDHLRALSQHYNVCFVIASRQKLINLPFQEGVSSSPFFNCYNEEFLARWDESLVRSLMQAPLGRELDCFSEDDFDFMSELTGNHPFLLQIGCSKLFIARKKIGSDKIDYGSIIDDFMQSAESFYQYYWKNEIMNEDRTWLEECRRAISMNDPARLEALQDNSHDRKNKTIRIKLARLGLVSGDDGPIVFPTGFKRYLDSIS